MLAGFDFFPSESKRRTSAIVSAEARVSNEEEGKEELARRLHAQKPQRGNQSRLGGGRLSY